MNPEAMFHPRIVELLNARLCHDLISPVSAIGNGVELMTEFGGDAKGEVVDLIGEAAQTAAARLQFFRIAFGSALGADGMAVPLSEARTRALAALDGQRIAISWPEEAIPQDSVISRYGIKLVLNMLAAGCEVLSGSGTVVLSATTRNSTMAIDVAAARNGLSLSDEMRHAFRVDADVLPLTPRTVQARYTAILGQIAGDGLTIRDEPGRIRLSADLVLRGSS